MRYAGCRRSRAHPPAHAGKTKATSHSVRAAGAHPRSCGENFAAVWGTLRDWGSSPLTRGKRHCRFDCDLGVGLIPAHAGKTYRCDLTNGFCAAHPRSRGENFLAVCTCGWRDGSSPLTRGKRRKLLGSSPVPRLIPAHAGKTYPRTRPYVKCGAHPRSRGENSISRRSRARMRGSSPLTRGKRDLGLHLEVRLRLIPAHAGKTYQRSERSQEPWAYPRSHGENCCPRATTRL